MRQLAVLFLLVILFVSGCAHTGKDLGLHNFAQGLIYEDEEKPDKAIGAYRKAIGSAGESAYLYVKIGNQYVKKNDSAGAKRAFFRAIRLNPGTYEAYFGLGLAYLLEDNGRLAASYMEKGLEMDPDNHSARMILCDLYAAAGMLNEAIVHYEVLLEHYPNNYMFLYNYGKMLERKGRLEEAEQAYLDTIDVAAGFWQGYLALGMLYNRQGRNEDALRYFRKATILNPMDRISYSFLVSIYYGDKNDPERAKQLLLEAISRGLKTAEFYSFLGFIYSREKEYEQAERFLRQSIEVEDTSEARFYLGVIYDKTDDPESMEREMKRAIELNPDNAMALNYLGYTYLLQDRNIGRAYEMIKRACALEPDNGAFLDSLGWAYYKMGRYRRALRYLQKAASLEKDEEIYEHLGHVYRELGDYVKSVHWFIKSYELSGNEEILEELEAVKKRIKK